MTRTLLTLSLTLLLTAAVAPAADAHDPTGQTYGGLCAPLVYDWEDLGLEGDVAYACPVSQDGHLGACAVGPQPPTQEGLCAHYDNQNHDVWVCTAEPADDGSPFGRTFHQTDCIVVPVHLVTDPVEDYPYPYPITCPPTRGICIG